MPIFLLFSLVVLIVGFVQKDKKLKIVGTVGIILEILWYAAIFIGFAFSEM